MSGNDSIFLYWISTVGALKVYGIVYLLDFRILNI